MINLVAGNHIEYLQKILNHLIQILLNGKVCVKYNLAILV